ncbi:(Fe-S)-binding protein [Acetobacterium wieringae]|uniref:(Fe-S)-binding protein n=1 Tax=Acetobacterium wieringae TaxID=52694 RepID=UPI002B20FA88|nr:(Fe-S)-binding protein [Acetobacterium wieringae]MEA4807273.1 (Fe-S)-binding protein [Acetobacterium wieringae]
MSKLEITQNIVDSCIECGQCMDVCEFLPKVCKSPKNLAEEMVTGRYVAKTEVPYLCNMCGKCATVCPVDLNIGDMIQEVRVQVFEEDIPLPGNIKYVKNQQKFVASDQFFLAKPAPSGNTKRMFFPGCHLSGYSADLVDASWRWMNKNDEDCGLLLTCCGAPSYDTGDKARYEEILGKVKATMAEYGATELVTACSNCTMHFRDYSDIATVSLYEVMNEKWDSPAKKCGTWVMHDPCKSRTFPEMQKAARELLKKAGCDVKEPDNTGADAKCCGMGGLVGYTDADWAGALSKQRAEELGGDLVTYCASCRQAMRPYERNGVHVLDILFNDDLETAKQADAHGAADAKKSQLKTRELLSV